MRMPDYQDLIGRRFVPGGRSPAQGLDCYGVLLVILRRMGLDPPDPYAIESAEGYADFAAVMLATVGESWDEVPVRERRCGDALLLSGRHHPHGHVAVYLDERRVLNATEIAGVTCVPFARLARHVKRMVRLRESA